MSTFSNDIKKKEEDGAGWGGLSTTAAERRTEKQEEHAAKCVLACSGLPDGAIDGGWTAAGMSNAARKLEDALNEILKLSHCQISVAHTIAKKALNCMYKQKYPELQRDES